MRKIEILLSTYGASHQNNINKLIHWVCVPLIMFSLTGLIMSIPFFTQKNMIFNWSSIVLAVALIYYYRLSFNLFVGFLLISLILLFGNWVVIQYCHNSEIHPILFFLIVFATAWIGQFIGHEIEGKKPSFVNDVQFLLIGPAWLLHFLYKKWGINY